MFSFNIPERDNVTAETNNKRGGARGQVPFASVEAASAAYNNNNSERGRRAVDGAKAIDTIAHHSIRRERELQEILADFSSTQFSLCIQLLTFLIGQYTLLSSRKKDRLILFEESLLRSADAFFVISFYIVDVGRAHFRLVLTRGSSFFFFFLNNSR